MLDCPDGAMGVAAPRPCVAWPERGSAGVAAAVACAGWAPPRPDAQPQAALASSSRHPVVRAARGQTPVVFTA